MRAVVQRVKKASVSVENKTVGKIEKGLLVFLGVGESDTEADIEYIAKKVSGLRIFPDSEGKMNLSAMEKNFDVLVISQFTLYGNVKKGSRPSFTEAASPDKGEMFYNQFCEKLELYDLKVERGVFGAMMDVDLINDGPVTILIDSTKTF